MYTLKPGEIKVSLVHLPALRVRAIADSDDTYFQACRRSLLGQAKGMRDFSQVATHCPNETIARGAMICARLQELWDLKFRICWICSDSYKANPSEKFMKQNYSDWSWASQESQHKKKTKIHVGTGHHYEILAIESVQHKPQQMKACPVSLAHLLALSRRGDAWQLAPESSQSWLENHDENHSQ